MNIVEATKISIRTKKGITRKSWMPKGPIILPTNSMSGCIIEPHSPKDVLGRRWQPSVDDLVANDWVGIGELDKWN